MAFREQPLGRSILVAMRDAGVESVELTDDHPGFQYHDLKPFEDIRNLLGELDLHLNSLHIHLARRHSEQARLNPVKTMVADDGIPNLASEFHSRLSEHRSAIDVMEVLGGGILVTHDISLPPSNPSRTGHRSCAGARTVFVDNLRELARYAAPKGVSFALENTTKGLSRDPSALEGLVTEVDEPNVGIVLDTGHRNLVGDVATALRTVADHLITLHIHDNAGTVDEHLLPGRGSIDWNECVQALRDGEYGGVFMYELRRPEDLSVITGNFETLMRDA